MMRPSAGLRPRPGWDRNGGASTEAGAIGQRRWRILIRTQPIAAGLEPTPYWVRTPEQFVDWLSLRIGPRDLRAYFLDIEEIARQSCDLELLRFARPYLGRSPKWRRG
jgi:hypothetical protein